MITRLRFWLLRVYDLFQMFVKVFYKTVMPFFIILMPMYYFMYKDVISTSNLNSKANIKAQAEDSGLNFDDYYCDETAGDECD